MMSKKVLGLVLAASITIGSMNVQSVYAAEDVNAFEEYQTILSNAENLYGKKDIIPIDYKETVRKGSKVQYTLKFKGVYDFNKGNFKGEVSKVASNNSKYVSKFTYDYNKMTVTDSKTITTSGRYDIMGIYYTDLPKITDIGDISGVINIALPCLLTGNFDSIESTDDGYAGELYNKKLKEKVKFKYKINENASSIESRSETKSTDGTTKVLTIKIKK